jgi:DNA-3-methyladenine glycosylase I
MCNSNVKSAGVAQIDGRPVLQPAGNRVAAAPDAARPLKKSLQKSLSMPASYDNNSNATAAAARPAPPENTRAAAAGSLLPPTTLASVTARAAGAAVTAEKSRSTKASKKPGAVLPVVTFAALEAFEPAAAGSIAAAQREHAAQAQAQRKMRIAHYGRTASFSRVEGRVGATATATAAAAAEPAVPASPTGHDEKRCSFITPYSGKQSTTKPHATYCLTPFFANVSYSALSCGVQTPFMSRTTTRSGECPCTTTSKQAAVHPLILCKHKLLQLTATVVLTCIWWH